tara:strand:- start:414 stop:590 length:177 start_codon:yes stop_codon:yes gene_type:complete
MRQRVTFRRGYEEITPKRLMEQIENDLSRFDRITYFEIQAQNDMSAIKIVSRRVEEDI